MSSARRHQFDRSLPCRLEADGVGLALDALHPNAAQHQHGKRWIVMATLMLLPRAWPFWCGARPTCPQRMSWNLFLAFMLIPQALLPLAALIYASGMIQDEQEEQTFTYLLIRPIPKWAFYTVKLIATLTVTILLTVFFTVLTYVAIYLGRGGDTWEIAGRC